MKLFCVRALEDNNRKSYKNCIAWRAVIMAENEEGALEIAKKHMYGDYVKRLEREGKLRISITAAIDENIYTY